MRKIVTSLILGVVLLVGVAALTPAGRVLAVQQARAVLVEVVNTTSTQIINPAANPVPVVEIGRTLYQEHAIRLDCMDHQNECQVEFNAVGDGLRLVITHISGFQDVRSGTAPLGIFDGIGQSTIEFKGFAVVPFRQRGDGERVATIWNVYPYGLQRTSTGVLQRRNASDVPRAAPWHW